MVYTVTFNPAVDYLVYLSEMKLGAVQRADREVYYFSGKGINASKVLTALGVENTALGFLAGFTGRAIADALTAEGIRHDFSYLPSGNTRINVKIRHGMETDLNCQGPDIPKSAIEAFYEKLKALQAGDLLILAGSVPKSLPKTVYADVMRQVEGRGVTVIVDADGDLLRNALSCRPFLIKPNREELEALLGREMDSEDALTEGARELQRRGARNVLVSLGGDGAILLSESGEVYRMDAAQGDCVNSIGAGDSMLAGFVAGYLGSGGDLSHALRLGTASGAATAFSEGMATRDAIEAILKSLPAPKKR